MREVHHISGAGNNSGLKIFESKEGALVIKVPKTLISRSWRYLLLGIALLLLSIFIPILVSEHISHFLLKMAFFAFSLSMLVLGGGMASVATWEIRSAIEITLDEYEMTIFHPAFFAYRSLTRTFKKSTIKELYVNKVRRIGREKYSLMIKNNDPLDERLIKGFYVPEQALWIASEVNKSLRSN